MTTKLAQVNEVINALNDAMNKTAALNLGSTHLSEAVQEALTRALNTRAEIEKAEADKVGREAIDALFTITGRHPFSYSGRGMMGKRCIAMRVDRGAHAPRGVVSHWADRIAEQVGEGFAQYRTDSLGLDSVVYWPWIAWPEGVEEPEEVDDDV